MPETSPSPPRVIIELSPSGQLILECYINGQRQRRNLNRGEEHWEILDELKRQERQAAAQAARKQEALEQQAKRRHNNVWLTAEQDFGTKFALTVIKGPVPAKAARAIANDQTFGKYMLPEQLPKSKAAPKVLPNLADLL